MFFRYHLNVFTFHLRKEKFRLIILLNTLQYCSETHLLDGCELKGIQNFSIHITQFYS